MLRAPLGRCCATTIPAPASVKATISLKPWKIIIVSRTKSSIEEPALSRISADAYSAGSMRPCCFILLLTGCAAAQVQPSGGTIAFARGYVPSFAARSRAGLLCKLNRRRHFRHDPVLVHEVIQDVPDRKSVV